MHLKNVLGQINTDSRNIHGGRSHLRLSGCKTLPLWHADAV
jgi:hypothetical protein